jgi:hypothetical protein
LADVVRRLPLLLLLGIAACLLAATAAQAANRFTLDATPGTPGNVIADAVGTAYVAWVAVGSSGPDTPRFCKIPRGGTCPAPVVLPIPGATALSDGAAGAFPVFGAGSTVYVVAPRYVHNDVVLYTSIDGGASFGPGVITPSSLTPGVGPYSSKTNPTDVLRVGSRFLIAANNSGLGFSTFDAGQGNFTFVDPGVGGVAGSTMGLDGANPVIAYWNISSPPYPVLFYRYSGAGSTTNPANWVGPTLVTPGYMPRLAGGASGLWLVSQDYASPASSLPTVLNVRKYAGTTFGAPLTLVNDPTASLFDGGSIAQSPSGRIAVVWPSPSAVDGFRVMRLFTSSDGGASFGGPANVAAIASGYALNDNAKLALADDGQGWVTFRDGEGLKVADLSPLVVAPPPPPPPVAAPPPPPVAPPAASLVKNTTVTVPGATITFGVPRACVRAGSKFRVRLSWKRKKRKGNLFVKVRRADFYIGTKRVKIDRVAPFTQTLTVTAGSQSGSTIRLRARAFIKVRRGKSPTKSIRATIRVC